MASAITARYEKQSLHYIVSYTYIYNENIQLHDIMMGLESLYPLVGILH